MLKKIIIVLFLFLQLGITTNFTCAQEDNTTNSSDKYDNVAKNEAGITVYYYKKGLMFFEKNEPDKALINFKEALAREPKDVKILNMIGLTLERMDKLNQAIGYYEEAIEVNPKFSDSYLNIAGAYFNKKKYDKTIEYIKKAIELSPEEPDYYYNLGVAYQYKGQLDEAIKYYEQAISLNPKLSKARLAISDCKEKLKQNKK